jgi:hypothetical protein
VLIAPEPVSTIESRYKDVNVFYGNGGDEHLPIIAAPMDTVIENNRYLFIQNSRGLCVPRTSRADVPIRAISVFPIFKAVSLEEFENYIARLSNLPDYILIDIANGHMSRLYKALDRFKKSKHFQYSHVMIGNIANPFTYKSDVDENDLSYNKELAERVMNNIFSESKVDRILSKYFVVTESEKKKIKTKKNNMFSEITRLSETVDQEMIAKKIVNRNSDVKLLGKTNQKNLVFEHNNKQFKVTTSGRIL